jgi:4-alpha-glucanotransferase
MRQAGVLLHVTALPGQQQSGCFGQEACDWIDLLSRHGVGVWQVLPLAPPDGTGSPYSSPSGSALNPQLLDHARLEAEGWSETNPDHRQAFERWRQRQQHWLQDHCRFVVLKRLHGDQPWWQWPADLAQRRPRALQQFDRQQADALRAEALLQWHLQRQWQALRRHAQQANVQIVGDLPFYVAHDSVDVWCHPSLFDLAPDGTLRAQSGVPPDYFSATGQLWGTPVYRWRRHAIEGFRWWLNRLQRQLELFDLLRLDHFRALESYWSVPGGDPTAENGHWVSSPGTWLLRLLHWRCRRRTADDDDGVVEADIAAIVHASANCRDRVSRNPAPRSQLSAPSPSHTPRSSRVSISKTTACAAATQLYSQPGRLLPPSPHTPTPRFHVSKARDPQTARDSPSKH